ncbi:MAG: hypothetical protein RBR19_07720 [Sedimentisphaerales bacterium]|nr:hypothetical protein [Sedimentisphaerales bacterium]
MRHWHVGVAIGMVLLSVGTAGAQQPDPPGQAKGIEPVHQAYLFAHMVHEDYGRLYYSVSLDGLHWTALNDGRRVCDDYRGHPDICKGHDGRYYLVGNRNDSAPDINFWTSDDLIRWERYSDVTPDLPRTPGYAQALPRIGAPKLFYDVDSSQYVLTWHTPHQHGTPQDPERYWASQRTLYLTSKDLKTFSDPPRRLFDWDMATIDVIIRKQVDRYYAIVKDERYPTLDWPTGKTIRISSAPALLGPYGEPSAPISPNFREAPTLIPSPDGKVWYLYYEQYPGVSYGLSVAANLDGPWHQISGYTFFSDWDKYSLPPKVRHGCMIAISRAEYDALVACTSWPGAAEGRALTFFGWSDQHVQVDGNADHLIGAIDAMNALPGRAWPESVGGAVAEPAFVFGLGDLTEWPSQAAREAYEQRVTRRLKFPSYDVAGNHDIGGNSPTRTVLDWLVARHGALRYTFEQGGVLFVALFSEYDESLNNPAQPISQKALDYLRETLANVPKGKPVIVATHLCFDAITNHDEFVDALGEANVLCILGGHYHKAKVTRYRQIDFVQLPSPAPNSPDEVTVFRITPDRLIAIPFDYTKNEWVTDKGKILDKPILGPVGVGLKEQAPTAGP